MISKNRQHWLRKMAVGLCALLVLSGIPLPGISLVDKVEAGGSEPATVTNSGYTELTSGNVYTGYASQNYLLNISNDFEPGALLDGASIIINDYQVGDVLTPTVTDSVYEITFDDSTGNGVYILTGSAPIEAYEAVLRGVRLAVTTVSKDRSITFSLGKALGFKGEDHNAFHYYEFVSSVGTGWFEAEDAAAFRTHFGRQGYLATITSSEENSFIAKIAQQDGWIGARDITRPNENTAATKANNENGDWRWVTGPEGLENDGNGRPFFKSYVYYGGPTTGTKGNPEPITDEETGKTVYSHWNLDEPNDADGGRGGEFVVYMDAMKNGTDNLPGAWNDFHPGNTNINGYIVEYGGMSGDSDSPISVTVNVVDHLRLESITVEDATPDQASLAFSIDLDTDLTLDDFAGLTIDGRHVVEVLDIDGDIVNVRMDEPFAPLPDGKLVSAYVPAEGNGGVTAFDGATELQVPAETGSDLSGDNITETNNIIPLKLVTAYVDGRNLKLVFNKPIDGDDADLDLSGLQFGGVAVQAPYGVDGHTVTVSLPQGATGNVLTYEDDAPSNIQYAKNPYDKFRDLLNPDNEDVLDPDNDAGLDLGDDQSFINPNAKLADNGLVLNRGDQPIVYSPDFDDDLPNGYRAKVPNTVRNIQLDPVLANPTGTIREVTLNGEKVEDLTNLPLRVGMNTIHINIYDNNHPELLLGQYEIIVSRDSPSSHASLSGLTISPGALNEPIDIGTTAYTASVANSVTSISVTPTVLDSTATLTVNGVAAVSGNVYGPIQLNVGTNTIHIEVTAQDAVTKTLYSIVVNRAFSAPDLTLSYSPTTVTNGSVAVSATANVYGDANSLTRLSWLPGSHSIADFAGGTGGTDILGVNTFVAASNGTYTVYAKDAAGNEAVEEIEITNIVAKTSTISPTSASFDKYARAAESADVTTMLTLNGNTLTSISSGATPLVPGTDYTVTGSTVTIKKVYLAAQPVGTTSLTFSFSAGSAQTLAITVSDTTPNGGGGRSPILTQPVIDQNGITVDPASIDTTKPSVTLEVTPKDGAAYVSIPASILTSFADKNATFFIEIKTPYGTYRVPVNLATLIPGLQDLLAANNLEAEDISFKITLSDKSGDRDIQAAFANGLPNGKVMGAMVDFSIKIVNTKTGQTIGTADRFSKAIARVIPMPKKMTDLPEQWGAYRYNETSKQFEFVPARKVQIDGVWYVMISSYSNSVYVVAGNAVSFADMQKHWGKPYVDLAAAKGLVEGVGGGRYDPEKTVTRAEFTAMLVRALGRGAAADGTASYNDVRPGAWYFGEVAYAKELGLLDFVSGNSFSPNQLLTREEMASMLASAVNLEQLPITEEEVSLNGYKDIGSVGAAYLEDVRLMVKLHIMEGTSADTFSPTRTTTRAEAAVVFVRTLQTLGLID